MRSRPHQRRGGRGEYLGSGRTHDYLGIAGKELTAHVQTFTPSTDTSRGSEAHGLAFSPWWLGGVEVWRLGSFLPELNRTGFDNRPSQEDSSISSRKICCLSGFRYRSIDGRRCV